MRMLRANAEALLTILEVLVGNPLYEWARDAAVQQRDPTPVGSHTPAVVEGGGGVVVFSVEVMLTGERVGDRADGRVSSR